MIRRTKKVIMAVAVVLLFFHGLAFAQWRGDQKIDGAGQSFEPAVAADGNHLYALFDTLLSNDWSSYLAFSHDGGRTAWTRKVISHRKWPRFDAEGLVVVIAEGEQGPGGGHGGGQKQPDKFWAEVSHDGGQTFQLIQLNTPDLFDLGSYPAVRIDGDRVYLHWSEDGGVNYLQVSTDAGLTWLPDPLTIPVRIVHELFEVSGDHLHSLVIEDQGGQDRLLHQRSVDGGITWTTQRLDDPSMSHQIPEARFTFSGGRLCAAWSEFYAFNQQDIFFSTSMDQGAAWSRPLRLNDKVPPKSAVVTGFDIAAAGEALLVAYAQRVPAGNFTTDVFARYSADGGNQFGASVQVNPVPSTIGFPMNDPRCAVAGERAVVTWIDPKIQPPGYRMAGAYSMDAGQTWSGGVIGTGLVWESQNYGLGYDEEGAVAVAFEKENAHVFANAIHQPFLKAQGDLTPGSSFFLEIFNAEASESGEAALVLLSATGPGDATGGVPLPGGRTLPVDFDLLTRLSLTTLVPLLTTGPITGGTASTPPATVPPGFSIGDLFGAALVFRSQGGLGSMTDTLKIH